MTTQTQPPPTPPAPVAAPRRSGPRVAAIVAGAILALGGAGAATAGGAILAVFGSDGTADTATHSFSTRSTALYSGVADIEEVNDVADVVGHPRVRLSVKSTGRTDGLFLGIGPAAEVDRYLAGAPTEEVTDIDSDPFKLDRKSHGGTKRPARPATQDFWVAQASGRDAATLRWKVRDGDYRVVLMNADGTRGVRADGDVGLTVPHLPTIAWSLLGGGILLLAGGVTAIVLGARTPRRRESA
jgi:hypothetical protein